MLKPNTTGMLRALGKPVQLKATRDSDGDKVIDIMDCKPYNRNKQGWIHDIKQKASGYLETKKKERVEAREQRYVETTKAEAARREERIRQAQQTATYKEKLKGEKQRAYIKSGGFFGQVGRVTSTITAPPRRTTSITRTTKPRYKYTYIKKKKGKGYTRKKTRIKGRKVSMPKQAAPQQMQPRTMPSIMDFKFKY